MKINRMEEALLRVIPAERLAKNESMIRHTTFKTGGAADFYVKAENISELSAIISACKDLNYPYFILGNGSNILVSDDGYRGVMIRLTGEFLTVTVDGTVIEAGAGCLMRSVSQEAVKNSLSGFEWGDGIPGTIGGAICMNAGAYGGEMKDIVLTVTLLTDDGEVVTLCGEDMLFGYRTSILKQKKMTVLSVVLGLHPGDDSEIREAIADFTKRRTDKQPLDLPSAGSTFKRPEGHFAGKLIEDAGLSGYTVGGAMVSTKHCGFVVNFDHATSADVYRVICDVSETVKKQTGVTLEPEVILLGAF